MGLLLKDALIITQNAGRDLFNGDILIEKNTISQVEKDISVSGHKVYQFAGLVIAPGFIQSHVHLCQTLFRNLSDDLELLEWLKQSIWPLEMSHDEESLRASARLGLTELLLNGTTCILDMGNARYQEIIFQEMVASGIRGASGMVMMDTGEQSYRQETGELLSSTRALIKEWHNSHNGCIKYALAPRFVLSCSPKLWSEVKKLSDEFELIIHSHCSENKTEWQEIKRLTGYSNLEYFVRNQLASPRLCLAHCIWVSAKEIQMMADYHINVLHCPGANLKLGSGIAPTPEFLKKGINVSLGSDGAACNNNLDIFNEMRLAALIQKPKSGVTSLSARATFDMATIGGAKSLGMSDEIGSIEPGKKADLVVLDLNKVHSIPADDIYAQIVYSGKASSVQHVMVDGKWVVYDRKVQNYSEKQVIDDAWKQIQILFARQKSSSEISKEV